MNNSSHSTPSGRRKSAATPEPTAEPSPEPSPQPEPPVTEPDLDPGAVEPTPSSPDAAPTHGATPGERVLEGVGIDPSGATVSTVAASRWFAALPAGTTVVVRGGDVIALDATLRIDRRIDIRGGGELRFVGGIAGAPALKLITDGTTVSGVRITYTGGAASTSGERNVGIDIHASDVVIDGVTIDGFQNGIIIRPSGEYGGVVVTNCHVLGVTGAGGGTGSDSSAGEDRGDGVTIWGARATIVGNIIAAAPGADARIGIHAEGLPDYASDPGPWADAMITISGNVVTGPFRRGVALEGVSHAVVSANTVSDATWWGIGVFDTRSVAIIGNTVRWTRTAAETPGSAWKPSRCPIMVYRDAQAITVEANLIEIRGDAAAAIMLFSAPPIGSTAQVGATDAVISDNVVRLAAGTCPIGIAMDRAIRPIVSGNRLTVSLAAGVVGGVLSYLCVDAMVSGNSVSGAATTSGYGVHHQGASSIVVTGNRIDRIRVGVAVINCTEGATIVANTARGCEYGLDTYGTTGRSVVEANRWESTGTAHANAQPNTSYLSTRHMGLARPFGGASGDLLVGNGRLWVNDQGTWRSAALT
ncbi:MAG TPA: right-handed parallel beta-helix repeat-containing protein [Plantibacter sp.]|uniref:right-handed parallel beta-helix repeat-containing protein n=1 Tax=unclassified Plantibacter TaxID=2624265 RepID=UPI002C95AA61|nr:right-handed parallel beta-helix repeat-containing protein [Plantibacter sp.]